LKLRTRVVIVVMATTLCLSAILFGVLQTVLTRDYEQIENKYMQQNLDRIQFAIDEQEINISKLLSAYAVWDATYTFVEDSNQAYIDNYFVAPTFVNSEINIFAIIDNSGKIIHAENFDLRKRVEAPLSEETKNAISDSYILCHTLQKGPIGILQTGEGPLLFATYPILTSMAEGPVHGTVLMGRYLDDRLIEILSTLTKLPITINKLEDFNTKNANNIPALSAGNPVLIKPFDSKTLSGYYIVSDIHGNPYLVVGAQTPRDIYSQGRITILWLLLGIAVIAGAIILAIVLFLDRLVLSRLKILSNFAAGISREGTFSSRVYLKGQDELAGLSNEMNAMIAKLAAVNNSLLESENKYSTLVEKSSDGIILITDEKVTYANPRMLQILGMNQEELLGSNNLSFTNNKFRAKASDMYYKRLNGESVEGSYEIELDRKDGTSIPVEVSAKVIKLNYQNCDMVIFRDITERKLMEEKIIELYNKEKSQRQELEEEAQERSLFIDILAHELRNPLTPIISSSELLQDLEKGDSNPIQRKLIANIRNGTDKLARKLEELLDMARYSRGSFTLNRQKVETKSYLEEVISRFKPALEKRQQRLNVEIADGLPVMEIDPSRIDQVLVNLLSNASKFSPEQSCINIKAFLNEGRLEIDVEDQGIGISPDDQTKLFRPYFRVKQSNAKVSGLGLGLTVCKKIIEAHGGIIWITSLVGQGSTFSFRIPLK
jgi:PAS domain S-box-containing protein